MKFDGVRHKFVLSLLISMCKENLYAKMEKLEAQICRFIRQGLKVMPWFKVKVIFGVAFPKVKYEPSLKSLWQLDVKL